MERGREEIERERQTERQRRRQRERDRKREKEQGGGEDFIVYSIGLSEGEGKSWDGERRRRVGEGRRIWDLIIISYNSNYNSNTPATLYLLGLACCMFRQKKSIIT